MSRILIIEDNETMREGMLAVAGKLGHEVEGEADGESGIARFGLFKPDLVISDLKLGDVDGIDVLRAVKDKAPEVPVIIVTAHGTIEVAVEAMQLGALDFIEKPFGHKVLAAKIDKALEVGQVRARAERLEEENEALKAELSGGSTFEELVGESEAMRNGVFRLIEKIAPTDSTVLITGESGTGKELVARALHARSGRVDKPMVKVSCGALPETLLESELFGHEKGAFTGASKRKLGRFELAHRGTLFLDEIGEISAAIQVKLLRAIQEKEFERVGGEESLRVDVRVVAATNKDLGTEVRNGRFREDLYYRLNVLPIQIPPLRERKGDLELLVVHFIHKLRERTDSAVVRASQEALALLQSHGWPGNVRELENTIERALVFAAGVELKPADLPPSLGGRPAGGPALEPDADKNLPEILDDLERQLILRAFEQAKGVKTETARLLGIKTSALYYKLQKYGIE